MSLLSQFCHLLNSEPVASARPANLSVGEGWRQGNLPQDEILDHYGIPNEYRPQSKRGANPGAGNSARRQRERALQLISKMQAMERQTAQAALQRDAALQLASLRLIREQQVSAKLGAAPRPYLL
eukprot:SAG31_NODE_7434_length_1689_cov_1.840881_2_plen_125_part_00